MNYLFKNDTLVPMDYFLNKDVFIQIESEMNENMKRVYYITTFFRHSHKVHVTNKYEDYERTKKVFNSMIKLSL